MTRIKLCGLSRPCDIEAANALRPEYVGFVFAPKSKRYVSPGNAVELKRMLAPGIRAVGVFVNEQPDHIAALLHQGVIDLAQLHGGEDEAYVAHLRQRSAQPIIRAFRIGTAEGIERAEHSMADYVLLDSGGGSGTPFDWNLIQNIKKPYFLAGGLSPETVSGAVARLHPFAVDVSSGIETDGVKDSGKMAAFVAAVRVGDKA